MGTDVRYQATGREEAAELPTGPQELPTGPLQGLTSAQVFDRINESNARRNQETLELLELFLYYDTKESWREDGSRSMSDWICYHLKTNKSTARTSLRVAHALPDLPHIKEVFSEGLLSFDQLQWLVELATPEEDEFWASVGPESLPTG